VIAGILAAAASPASAESVIHTFIPSPFGAYPSASVIQASDGNLYGTTEGGGTGDVGTVFKISNLGGAPVESVVYNFARSSDGANPHASLLQASDGNLYGTTYNGGSHNLGAVFEISDLGGTPTESVVYSFAGWGDGALPEAALIQTSDGSLYGTTSFGGSSSLGTVFKISNLGGTPTESVIYSFAGGADGANPHASLIQASDGNLYGTTAAGGANNTGTVFEISDLAGTPTENVIYSFAGAADGANPQASLIQASDGNLYGTTVNGGVSSNWGAVFKISNPTTSPTESLIYSFAAAADGASPQAALIQASDGNLYGTTFGGGANSAGTVFQISNLGGTPIESIVYSFTGVADGTEPVASLLQASDGNLYGTTPYGGASWPGTVFRISDLGGTPTESVVFSFIGGVDGVHPSASLIQASDGDLYGTTQSGGGGDCFVGADCGTAFRISNLGGTPTENVVYSFAGGADGMQPYGPVIQASDGSLYGTTAFGGARYGGTVFKITDPGGTPTESVVYSFAGGVDGILPYASLTQASNGDLYGTTSRGGTSDLGTVFKIGDPGAIPTESVIYSFTGGADGSDPSTSLIQASDGNLYGTNATGGTSSFGIVFRISNLGGTPTFSVIYSFTGGGDGAIPQAALIQGSDGYLYGTTYAGGANNSGTIFKIGNLGGTPTETVVYSFTMEGFGAMYPQSSLIQAADGNLYGTTYAGGATNLGTIFRISNLAGTPNESVISSFVGGADGVNPQTALIQASNGNLYGTTYSGGTANFGAVFVIDHSCLSLDAAIAAPAAVCNYSTGNTASVADAGVGATYAWTIMNGTITAGAGTPSITFTADSSGSVWIGTTVTTSTGCSATGSATISIGSYPFAGIFAASSVCAGSTDNSASVSDAGAGATYDWTITGGTITGGSGTPVITYTAGPSGSVQLGATVTNSAGCSDTRLASVAINDVPDASISAPSGVVANSTGNTASVPVTAGATYAWSIVNGTITAGAGTDTITFTAGASGTVDLSVTVTITATGCSSTGNQSITINPVGTVLRFFTITPCRLIDTRRPDGTYGGPALSGGTQRDFPIDGQCGIPADAYAVSANVTAVVPTANGDLRAYPTGTPVPSSSIINFNASLTRANNVLVPLTGIPTGSMTIQTDIVSGSTHFLFDVDGYFRFGP
jgi:uncharacterized repeat protein (TIGR03803 family)